MELKNEFRVSVPIEQAWATLTDVEYIAPCMPGAKLTEIDGEEFKGQVKVKVGPITAQYNGVDLSEFCSGHARGDVFDISQGCPCLLDRNANSEFIFQLHRPRSSTVSMSSGEPSQATRSTSSGLVRKRTRAPSSPESGNSDHTELAKRTGFPARPS
jgi:hypothetical protein